MRLLNYKRGNNPSKMMKQKVIERYTKLFMSLDNEAKLLAELRNEIMREEDYSMVGDMISIEDSLRNVQSYIVRQFESLTEPPSENKNTFLHDNVD